ncbi:hypothetical protein SCRM01_211 [Synechococcus phage S-CRM01]|uniref:hypothetical protein n=1 Tax=Synechococcus phage S-CRM01 TaxID=1026955 RepID=UPI000209E424|nr:hypothetical protein SCRM01_211 [Synechococcus phage S-CRM01]AEC53157.1 hypothetical protein SCRM01_211 [Synechococcus phage S-CRM01]
MKLNSSIVVAILAFGVMVGGPAFASGSDKGVKIDNRDSNTNHNQDHNTNTNNNQDTNNNTNNNKAYGGAGGSAKQGQAQGQAQGQLQGQAQGQAIVGSGNSAQGQKQSVNGSGNSSVNNTVGGQSTSVGGQSNSQSSSFVNSNVYLPERINPTPVIDYANTVIGGVACPTPGLVGGVSYADGNYGFGGYGAGSDVVATLGIQVPFATNGVK